MSVERLKREPKLAISDGQQTQYGAYTKEVNKAYENLGFVGSSLRYYYYLLASKGFIPDAKNAAKTFSKVTMQARDFGQIPWDAIIDENRPILGYVPKYYTRESWIQIDIDNLKNAHKTYKIPRWYMQPYHVEVWLEKMALGRIFEKILNPLEVHIPTHRGYSSGGFLNKIHKKLKAILNQGKVIIILYFGDWNPSGEDSERAMKVRLQRFGLHNIDFHRIAVTKNQIDQYNLPTAPADLDDSRAMKFIQKHGDNRTVNLDALVAIDQLDEREPFRHLIYDSVQQYFDEGIYQEQLKLQEKERRKIRGLVNKKVKFL